METFPAIRLLFFFGYLARYANFSWVSAVNCFFNFQHDETQNRVIASITECMTKNLLVVESLFFLTFNHGISHPECDSLGRIVQRFLRI